METSPSKQIINLSSLLDFSAKLNETYDEFFILNSTLLSLMGKLKILRACVVIPENEGKFRIALAKGKMKLSDYPSALNDSLPELSSISEAEDLLQQCGLQYFLPVIYQGETLAVICLGKKADSTEFTEEEEQYTSLVCTISANALQSARIHQSLLEEKKKVERRSQLLGTLFEMGRGFSALLSREQILKMLSYHLMGQLMVSRFIVFLFDESGAFEVIINRFPVLPSEPVVKELALLQETVHISKIEVNEETKKYLSEIDARIISPMIIQGEAKGLLIAGKKMSGGTFNEENIQFLGALGNISIAALENERLFKEEVEKKRLESELELALEIQKNLLPKETPHIPNFQIAGTSIPSRHVGGDYYDFIKLSDNLYLIAIADVSGKGMPASLLMANVQASLRLLAPLSLPIIELILRINELIYQNTTPDKFVTFFCGILDTNTRVFRYVNAGHNPPMWHKNNGKIELLKEGGLIIGFTDEPFEYKEGEIQLSPGEIIFMFTDGMPDAPDKDNNEYGEERLSELIKHHADKSPALLLETIIDDINRHSEGSTQYDDITCIVLKAE